MEPKNHIHDVVTGNIPERAWVESNDNRATLDSLLEKLDLEPTQRVQIKEYIGYTQKHPLHDIFAGSGVIEIDYKDVIDARNWENAKMADIYRSTVKHQDYANFAKTLDAMKLTERGALLRNTMLNAFIEQAQLGSTTTSVEHKIAHGTLTNRGVAELEAMSKYLINGAEFPSMAYRNYIEQER